MSGTAWWTLRQKWMFSVSDFSPVILISWIRFGCWCSFSRYSAPFHTRTPDLTCSYRFLVQLQAAPSSPIGSTQRRLPQRGSSMNGWCQFRQSHGLTYARLSFPSGHMAMAWKSMTISTTGTVYELLFYNELLCFRTACYIMLPNSLLCFVIIWRCSKKQGHDRDYSFI